MRTRTVLLMISVFALCFISCAFAQEADEIQEAQEAQKVVEVVKEAKENPVAAEAPEAAETIVIEEAKEPAKIVEKKEPIVAKKELTGQVSGLAKNFVAIIYEGDISKDGAREAAFPLERTPELERIASLDQLKEGDTITVRFEDTTTFDDSGKETTTRKIEKIIFVKPAPVVTAVSITAEDIEERAVNAAAEAGE